MYEEFMKMTPEEVAERGLTEGKKYFFKCPHCDKASRISDYGGNLVEESVTCPKCERLITNDLIKGGLYTRLRPGPNAPVHHKGNVMQLYMCKTNKILEWVVDVYIMYIYCIDIVL